MDQTPRYLRMCLKAKQIQTYKRGYGKDQNIYLEKGDWYFLMQDGEVALDQQLQVTDKELQFEESVPCVWVPTGGQLLDFQGDPSAMFTLAPTVDQWRKKASYLTHIDERSLEQLLLAFHMRTKYQMTWNGFKEEWEPWKPVKDWEA